MLSLEIREHDDIIRFGKYLKTRCESVRIPLGPHDNSDYIEINADDIGEVCVLHRTPGSVECVLSVLPEEV